VTGLVKPVVVVNEMKLHPNSAAQQRRKAVAARMEVIIE